MLLDRRGNLPRDQVDVPDPGRRGRMLLTFFGELRVVACEVHSTTYLCPAKKPPSENAGTSIWVAVHQNFSTPWSDGKAAS